MKNKKLFYIILAVFVIFASCENSFEGTELNKNALKETVGDGRTNSKGFTIEVDDPVPLFNTKNQVITVEASVDNVDWDTLSDAMTIYKLKNASDENSVYERDGSIDFKIQSVRDKKASLLMDLSSVKTNFLEVFVNPTILTAANGSRKLNFDGDRHQGEEGDDDYIEYLYVHAYVDPETSSTPTPITMLDTGLRRNPRHKFLISFGHEYNSGGLINGINVTFDGCYYDEDDVIVSNIVDTTNYKSLFDNTFVVERFVVSSKKWETIKGTTTYEPATSDYGYYEVRFAEQPEGTPVRIRIENIQNLKSSKPVAGYIAKYEYDNDINTEVRDTYVSLLHLDYYYLLRYDDLTSYFDVSTHFDSNGYNGSIVLDFQNSLGTFGSEGLDLSTIKAESFKIIRDDGVNVEVVEAKPEYDGSSIPTKIELKLPENYKKTFEYFTIFVSPDVKTYDGKSLGAPWNVEEEPYGFNKIESSWLI